MNTTERIQTITSWISDYAKANNIDSLVVGVSGGIDSAVVSTLCALTGIQTYVLSLPIRQRQDQHDRSIDHCISLLEKHDNVHWDTIDLTTTFETFEKLFPAKNKLALANSRARLRMTTLYQAAAAMPNIAIHGVDCHIGSQITEIAPFIDALDRVIGLVDALEAHNIPISHIDVGGGIGITYDDETPPAFKQHTQAILAKLNQKQVKLLFEPGRA